MGMNMSDNVNQQPCCIFRCLIGDKVPGSSKIEYQHVELDGKLLANNQYATQSIQLAWGVVLRFYVACDDIAFLYANTSAQEQGVSLCSLELPDRDSFQSLTGKGANNLPRWRNQPLDGTQYFTDYHGKVNTMVVESVVSGDGWDDTKSLEAFYLTKEMDLVLQIQRSKHSTRIALSYSTSVIDNGIARSVVETFKGCVSHLVNSSGFSLNDVDPCSPYDFNLLSLWNPPIPERQVICVHEAILQQCIQSPDDIAVDSWDGILTYRELDFLSAQLGQRLVDCGVYTGTLTLLCFEKSKWAIVAILGVLRAGGAYAFLDPSSPPARMNSMCQDLQAKYLVCSTLYSALGDDLGLQTIVASVPPALCQEGYIQQQFINPDIRPSDPIYVAFSSGSTGKPKGVVIEHGAFWLRAMANKQALSMSKKSKVLQFANYVFDVSNRDILYTLIFGGCVCVPSDFDRLNSLMEFMAQKQINWASLTPSVSNLLDPNGVPHLNQLILCGEPMTPLHIANWSGSVDLINAYGPSETVTISSIRSNMSAAQHHMNIGYGAGSNIWVVDANNYEKLLPIGVVGELLIESPSIGRGYINNPEQTNAHFIPAPGWLSRLRGNSCPRRVYRTGDLGRHESDGSIRFIGRKDSQVKIRGQRVELSEVEHHIQRIIGQDLDIPVLVDIIEPKGLNTSLLVAFFPTMQNTKPVPSGLHTALRDTLSGLDEKLSQLLPSYMIPSRFIAVERIPMTATGKKNRRQLRQDFAKLSLDDLDKLEFAGGKKQVPTCEMEQRLQQLWAPILGIEASEVGPGDSFFRLGGNSIAAMRVVSLARSQGLDLSVADILEHKQIDRLANLLSTRPIFSSALHVTPLSLLDPRDMAELPAKLSELRSKDLIADIVPVTETQKFFLTQWSLSSFCLRLVGVIDIDRLRAACETVTSQHSSLRSCYTKLGDTIVQVFLKEMEAPFHHVQVGEKLESAYQATLKTEIQESPVSGNPPIKFTLMSQSKTEHALIVRLSHAQYDGYSSPTLFKSISSAYNNVKEASRLPLPTPYSHYLYACYKSKTKAALDFWRENLRESSMSILPSRRILCKDSAPKDIRQTVSSKIPTPPQELTVPTLMNAALSVILSRRLRVKDVVFGVVMNTRDISVPGVEEMIGACININPFRARLPSTQTGLELCHSLQHQYVQVSRFGYLNLPDIAANCTDWAHETKLGVMINHLDGAKQPTHLTLDGALCISSQWKANINISDQVLVRSITTEDELQVQVLTSDRLMSEESARAMARELADTAHLLSKRPDLFLSSLHSKEIIV